MPKLQAERFAAPSELIASPAPPIAAAQNIEQQEEPYDGALFSKADVQLKLFSKLPTPVDYLSGLPLPIMPPEDIPDFNKGSSEANWHHHFHPSDERLLTSTDGLVIRNARLQRVAVSDHNEYHAQFEGPRIPEDAKERFKVVVWTLAGYVPDAALSFDRDSYEVIPLNNDMRQRLQDSGELKIAAHDSLVKFLRRHVASQDLSHVNENIVDQFLEAREIETRLRLGQLLLAQAAKKASSPLEDSFQRAFHEGLISKQGRALKLSRFILEKMGSLQQRHSFAMQLRLQANWPRNVTQN